MAKFDQITQYHDSLLICTINNNLTFWKISTMPERKSLKDPIFTFLINIHPKTHNLFQNMQETQHNNI